MENNIDIPNEVLIQIAAQAEARRILQNAQRSGFLHETVASDMPGSPISEDEFKRYRRLYKRPQKDDEETYKRHKRLNWQFPLGAGIVGAATGAASGAMLGSVYNNEGPGAALGAVSGATLALIAMSRAKEKRNKLLRAELKLNKRAPKHLTGEY